MIDLLLGLLVPLLHVSLCVFGAFICLGALLFALSMLITLFSTIVFSVEMCWEFLNFKDKKRMSLGMAVTKIYIDPVKAFFTFDKPRFLEALAVGMHTSSKIERRFAQQIEKRISELHQKKQEDSVKKIQEITKDILKEKEEEKKEREEEKDPFSLIEMKWKEGDFSQILKIIKNLEETTLENTDLIKALDDLKDAIRSEKDEN
jgi:hypothetical protein